MKQFKARASGAHLIMTNGRTKGSGMGETAKTYLIEWLADELFGKTREVFTKYTEKGLQGEDQSIQLLADYLQVGMIARNEDWFFDDYVTGTPDVIVGDTVYDVKSSWDHQTFLKAVLKQPDKGYIQQLQCYMSLTGKEKAALVYCLVDAPTHLITNEAWSECRVRGIEYSDKLFAKHQQRLTFSNLPLEKRIFVIEVEKDPDYIPALIERVGECREFIETLKNTLSWK